VFVINFLILGYLGVQPPSPIGSVVSQVGTLFYFGFFLLMPWWSRIGEFKPVPDRVTFKRTEPGENNMKKLILTLSQRWAWWPAAARRRRRHRLGQGPVKRQRPGRAAKRRQAVRQLLPELPLGAFMRYNRLKDIGLTEQQIKDNLLFTTDKVGDTMKAAIDPSRPRSGSAPTRPT
jgi:hypothetical protein